MISQELQKDKYKGLKIGDFGCGEGKLELQLVESGHKKDIIHSFDAGKIADHVVQCDISHVPLQSNELEIGVFCLSLMGTNFPQFIKEANRVIRKDGKLFIAEVLSRFEDVDVFCSHMKRDCGFKLLKMSKLKDFFYIMVFTKVGKPMGKGDLLKFQQQLKPCLYKKR